MGYVDSTLGAVFVGFNISCVVFGVLTTQAYVYFQRFPLDRLPYKILVSFLLIKLYVLALTSST